jgi:hypothetical protein
MSDQQPPIPGAEGAGRRRPRADDTPEQLKGIRATLSVIGRDVNDLRGIVEQAAAQSAAAATTAEHTRDDTARLAQALGSHLDGFAAWSTEVDEAIAALTDDDEQPVKGQPSWLTIDGSDSNQANRAVKLLADLADWIAQVWRRYPDSDLPHCWAYHPWAVSELLAVWQAWRQAYVGKGANPTRVAEWLDRWRPNTHARLDRGIGGCSLANHRPDNPLAYLPPHVPGGDSHLEDVARWWATSHGQERSPAPSPGAVLAERAETS